MKISGKVDKYREMGYTVSDSVILEKVLKNNRIQRYEKL